MWKILPVLYAHQFCPERQHVAGCNYGYIPTCVFGVFQSSLRPPDRKGGGKKTCLGGTGTSGKVFNK